MDFHYTILEPVDEHEFDKNSSMRVVIRSVLKRTICECSFKDCNTKEDVASVLINLGNEIKDA